MYNPFPRCRTFPFFFLSFRSLLSGVSFRSIENVIATEAERFPCGAASFNMSFPRFHAFVSESFVSGNGEKAMIKITVAGIKKFRYYHSNYNYSQLFL